ncbi:MAG: hypothetical protein H0W09_02920 [Solirubrobacterales bacterium]|nr:hypothetical protein [Solirubrobacterales bacterium]
MRQFRLMPLLVLALVLGAGTTPALAHYSEGPTTLGHELADGPIPDPEGDDQHGVDAGHLPASSSNVDLVGKLTTLTNQDGGIADVAAFGDYAYLAAFRPECVSRGGAGTGVHVVDISNPAAPAKVGFLAAEANSYVGEGVHVMRFGTRSILVHNNETCNSAAPVVSGFSVWDVTNPLSPVKLGQFGDTTPAVSPNQTYHTTHSVQGFVWNDKAYAVAQDNQDLKDVDIFDITPAILGTGPAVLVAEVGLEDWPGAINSFANGQSVFHHDMQQKVIGGRNFLLVSYWDAGQVLLNIDDPSNPVFVTDSDFTSPDPEFPSFTTPEGNSHQSYWSQDGRYLISTDEDFSPLRVLFEITSGPNRGQYGAGQFSWTVPVPEGGVTGSTVFGGSGCVADLNGNGVSDRVEVPSAATSGATVVVFSRGFCTFSEKVETGQLAGYGTVLIGNSHVASRNGLLTDSFLCGAKGHEFTVTVHGLCTGHRAMHLLFGDPPAYSSPEGYGAGGDLPGIGTLGASISASTVFDGWGYVHLHDATQPDLPELDTYAIPEAKDPAYKSGFGNLTVHEVKTDPRAGFNLAYFSWYSGGLRVARFGTGGLTEVGHYIAPGGSDFWGVVPLCTGQCLLNDRDRGRGKHNSKRPLLLMSDRDSGLWILRYTGKE